MAMHRNFRNVRVVHRYGLKMRNVFDFSKFSLTRWFPGHMAKGYESINRMLYNIDCVIEVHDARIPIAGRNIQFVNSLAQIKPSMLILNKVDLIDRRYTNKVLNYYQAKGFQQIHFTNCKNDKDVSITNMTHAMTELIRKSNRYHRAETNEYLVLVVGIPNVGKSSFINALRKRNTNLSSKPTRVTPISGTTMTVLERIKVNEDPPIYVLDTPGILSPYLESTEVGLKLALVAVLKDHLVGEEIIADYLLYKMNFWGNHKYVEYLGIDAPTDNIYNLLLSIATRNNFFQKIKHLKEWTGREFAPDMKRAASTFITAYRFNKFGPVNIDDVIQQ